MSEIHNFYRVNRKEMLDLIGTKDPDLKRKVVEQMAKDFGWGEVSPESHDFLFAAGEKVIERGDLSCEDAGWIYYGLTQLCDHELVRDGWKTQFTYEMLDVLKTTSLSEKSKGIIRGLIAGRDVNFNLMNAQGDDVTAWFISRDEAKALIEEIDKCPELESGKIENEVVEEIIFNEFLPTLDREIPEDHCFVAFTL